MYRENQFLILCTNICSICPIIFTWMVTISGIFINDLLLGETLSLISVKQAKKRKILMWKYVQLQAHDFFSSMSYNTHYLYKIVFSQNLITEHNNPIEDLIWHVCFEFEGTSVKTDSWTSKLNNFLSAKTLKLIFALICRYWRPLYHTFSTC